MSRVIVDENISESSPLLQQFRRSRAGRQPGLGFEFLCQTHPGIPDGEIITKVLRADTLLVTLDRQLHNQALVRGFRSFTLTDRGRLTGHRLKKIPLQPVRRSVHDRLAADYRRPPAALALVMRTGLPERVVERYRMAGQRIRRHFGSAQAITGVSITVASQETTRGLLMGCVQHLTSRDAVAPPRTREIFRLAVAPASDPALPAITALRESLLLQLAAIPTRLYIAGAPTLCLCMALQVRHAPPPEPLPRLLWLLLREFPALTLLPCGQGAFNDALRRKLRSLVCLENPDLRPVDYTALAAAAGGHPESLPG